MFSSSRQTTVCQVKRFLLNVSALGLLESEIIDTSLAIGQHYLANIRFLTFIATQISMINKQNYRSVCLEIIRSNGQPCKVHHVQMSMQFYPSQTDGLQEAIIQMSMDKFIQDSCHCHSGLKRTAHEDCAQKSTHYSTNVFHFFLIQSGMGNGPYFRRVTQKTINISSILNSFF